MREGLELWTLRNRFKSIIWPGLVISRLITLEDQILELSRPGRDTPLHHVQPEDKLRKTLSAPLT